MMEHDELKHKYSQIDERNKALRQKSGQVFLQTIQNKKLMAPADKKGETKVYLEDEEAINKMLKEIDN